MLASLGQDLVHALRRLRQAPGFTLVAVATLALGIGATSAIFSVVDAVLLRPLAYRDPERLVAVFVHETSRGERRAPTAPADFLEWRRASRALEKLTAAQPWSPVLTGHGDAEELSGLKATPGLFDLLGVRPLVGRTFQPEAGELQVVLGHALWQRRFGGDQGVVGRSLVLDERSYVVTGVMAPGFRFPPFWATNAELWTPLVFTPEQAARHERFLRVFGRLRPGEPLAAARAEMDVVGERLAREWPRSNADVRVNVEALQEPVVSGVRPALPRLEEIAVDSRVAAFALALVLLVGAALLAKSFLRLQRPDTGFRAEGLLTVTLSLSGSPRASGDRRPAFLEELLDDVGALAGVESAALVNHVPIDGDTWGTRFEVEGRPRPDPARLPYAVMRTASAGYLAAMGIPLLHGRDFDARDRRDSVLVVLVNRALARGLGSTGSALGVRIKMGGPDSDAPWRTVVGVFADARQADLVEPVQPEILCPYTQDPVDWYKGTTLVVRSATPLSGIAGGVTSRLRLKAPELPITRVRTMTDLLSDVVAQERLGALLMGLLSLVALALAVGGIYGVMAYAVGRRAHEIGVRMALGARPGAVEAMVLRDGLRLGAFGTGAGLLGALALSRVLKTLLHGVSPTDPATFAAAGLLLLTVAALASLLPARRAARLDPVATLREP
jgi:hypothetical protein